MSKLVYIETEIDRWIDRNYPEANNRTEIKGEFAFYLSELGSFRWAEIYTKKAIDKGLL